MTESPQKSIEHEPSKDTEKVVECTEKEAKLTYQWFSWGTQIEGPRSTRRAYLICGISHEAEYPIRIVEAEDVEKQNTRILESERNVGKLKRKQEKFHRLELEKLRNNGFYMEKDAAMANNPKSMKKMIQRYRIDIATEQVFQAILQLLAFGEIYCWKVKADSLQQGSESSEFQLAYIKELKGDEASTMEGERFLHEIQVFKPYSRVHNIELWNQILSNSATIAPRFNEINLETIELANRMWSNISTLFFNPTSISYAENVLKSISTFINPNDGISVDNSTSKGIFPFVELKTSKNWTIDNGQHVYLKIPHVLFYSWLNNQLPIVPKKKEKEEDNKKLGAKTVFVSRYSRFDDQFTVFHHQNIKDIHLDILKYAKIKMQKYLSDNQNDRSTTLGPLDVIRKIYEDVLLPMNELLNFSKDIDTILNSFIEWHQEITEKEAIQDRRSLDDVESVLELFLLLKDYYLSSDPTIARDSRFQRPGLLFHLLNQFQFLDNVDCSDGSTKEDIKPLTHLSRVDPSFLQPRQLLCLLYYDIYVHFIQSPDTHYRLIVDDPRIMRVLAEDPTIMNKVFNFGQNQKGKLSIICWYYSIPSQLLYSLVDTFPLIEVKNRSQNLSTEEILEQYSNFDPFTRSFLHYKSNSIQISIEPAMWQTKKMSIVSETTNKRSLKGKLRGFRKFPSKIKLWLYLKLSSSQELSDTLLKVPLKSALAWLNNPDTTYPLIISKYGFFTLMQPEVEQ